MTTRARILFVVLAVLAGGDRAAAATAANFSADTIAEASGAKATIAPDGVVRIGWLRDDVPVKVDRVPFPAAAGLGSWAAFKQDHGRTLMMGDTVVFQDEVDAAMDAAFANGLDVTALHNHFFYDEPRVYFMHIHGHGDAEALGAAVKAVWDAVKRVRSANAIPEDHFPGVNPSEGQIDPKDIERITKLKASPVSSSLVKVSIGRDASMHGIPFSESMGLNTWAAFSGSSLEASMDGDFAMTADEVPAVLKTLRANGVHIVALHNHMFGEQPGFYFTHFWGKGTVYELAYAFGSAIEAQRLAKRK